jgi:hypothetical protein
LFLVIDKQRPLERLGNIIVEPSDISFIDMGQTSRRLSMDKVALRDAEFKFKDKRDRTEVLNQECLKIGQNIEK